MARTSPLAFTAIGVSQRLVHKFPGLCLQRRLCNGTNDANKSAIIAYIYHQELPISCTNYIFTLPKEVIMTRSGKTSRSISSTGEDDFLMVTNPEPESQATFKLPLRPNQTGNSQHGISVEVQALQESEYLMVSIQPPKQPEQDLERASCDIVLVIDVSGSMNEAAPQPDVKDPFESEAAGLSILDLTKHAARTVLQTLTENDRLAIVTFSHSATVSWTSLWVCQRAVLTFGI